MLLSSRTENVSGKVLSVLAHKMPGCYGGNRFVLNGDKLRAKCSKAETHQGKMWKRRLWGWRDTTCFGLRVGVGRTRLVGRLKN